MRTRAAHPLADSFILNIITTLWMKSFVLRHKRIQARPFTILGLSSL